MDAMGFRFEEVESNALKKPFLGAKISQPLSGQKGPFHGSYSTGIQTTIPKFFSPGFGGQSKIFYGGVGDDPQKISPLPNIARLIGQPFTMEEQKKGYEQIAKTVFGAKPQAENVNVNLGLEIPKSRNPKVREQSSTKVLVWLHSPPLERQPFLLWKPLQFEWRYEQLWNRNLLKTEQP